MKKFCRLFHRWEYWPVLDLWQKGINVIKSRQCIDCGHGELYAEKIREPGSGDQ